MVDINRYNTYNSYKRKALSDLQCFLRVERCPYTKRWESLICRLSPYQCYSIDYGLHSISFFILLFLLIFLFTFQIGSFIYSMVVPCFFIRMKILSSLCLLSECLDNTMGFPSSSDGKSIHLQCGLGHIHPWVGKIRWRRKWQLTPVFLPGEFHGQRSLVGCKESDTTEQLTHIDNTTAVILNEYFQWIISLLVLLINCLNF